MLDEVNLSVYISTYLQLTWGAGLTQVNWHQNSWALPVEQILQAARKVDFKPSILPSYKVKDMKYWHTSHIVLIRDAAHGKASSMRFGPN